MLYLLIQPAARGVRWAYLPHSLPGLFAPPAGPARVLRRPRALLDIPSLRVPLGPHHRKFWRDKRASTLKPWGHPWRRAHLPSIAQRPPWLAAHHDPSVPPNPFRTTRAPGPDTSPATS